MKSKQGRSGGGPAADSSDAGRLAEYRRKRDFGRTAEPSGDIDPADRGARLEYVVQKHAASHLHYDLRLELDGAMKSWAVPKGPSLDPSVRRLAMQVEDHPLSYNDFEGTIPRGEYGGGTVMLWDRGSYVPDEVRRRETPEAAVRRGLKAGKLGFTVFGERLRGSFALVRTERGPKPKWLLFKHRDDSAEPGSDITATTMTSVESGRTMEEIAADTDRVWRSNRHGQQGGEEPRRSVQVAADTAPIAPMVPTPVTSPPDDDGWVFTPWRGGVHVLAYVTPEATRFIDARAEDVTDRYRTVAEGLAAFAGRAGGTFVLDGEIAEEEGTPTFFAGDLLLEDEHILLDEPWTARSEALRALLYRRRVPGTRRQTSDDDAGRMIRQARRHGWPGVLARRVDGRYEPGARAGSLLRITLS
jgi:bifunctional non-homologous end joining protein LigD